MYTYMCSEVTAKMSASGCSIHTTTGQAESSCCIISVTKMLGVHRIYKFCPPLGHEIVRHLGFNLQFQKRVADSKLSFAWKCLWPSLWISTFNGFRVLCCRYCPTEHWRGLSTGFHCCWWQPVVNLTTASLENSIVFPRLFLCFFFDVFDVLKFFLYVLDENFYLSLLGLVGFLKLQISVFH